MVMHETVTNPTDGTPRLGMNVVGYSIGGALLLLSLPVLPLLAVLALVDRLTADGTDGPDRRPTTDIGD